jgi:hypothetical protein
MAADHEELRALGRPGQRECGPLLNEVLLDPDVRRGLLDLCDGPIEDLVGVAA